MSRLLSFVWQPVNRFAGWVVVYAMSITSNRARGNISLPGREGRVEKA